MSASQWTWVKVNLIKIPVKMMIFLRSWFERRALNTHCWLATGCCLTASLGLGAALIPTRLACQSGGCESEISIRSNYCTCSMCFPLNEFNSAIENHLPRLLHFASWANSDLKNLKNLCCLSWSYSWSNFLILLNFTYVHPSEKFRITENYFFFFLSVMVGGEKSLL